ncbi:hypothetical protein MGH68_17925 [Erysipelothrix sp. D19-032]
MRPEDLTLTTSKQVARKRIRVKHGPTQRQNRRFMVGATILVIVSLWYVKLDFSMFVANIDKTYGIIGRLLNPNWAMALPYLTSFIDTLAIAFVALLTALLFALPIAYLTASNTKTVSEVSSRLTHTLFIDSGSTDNDLGVGWSREYWVWIPSGRTWPLSSNDFIPCENLGTAY